MAIKKRTTTLTTGTDGPTGTASKEVGLGAAYGRILRVEVKGDDANVDVNNTIAITDADGRIVYAAAAIDAGADDSTAKATEQSYSTVGLAFNPAYPAAADLENDATAGTVGSVGLIARSPVTVAFAAGTDGDVHRVHLFVEV